MSRDRYQPGLGPYQSQVTVPAGCNATWQADAWRVDGSAFEAIDELGEWLRQPGAGRIAERSNREV